MVFNKLTFNGRCISRVLYPKMDTKSSNKPYIVEIGYGSCEYNLETDATLNSFIGSATEDSGWPKSQVTDVRNIPSSSQFDSPNNRVHEQFGGLNTNKIRNYNEIFRLFWSMFMHGGWRHLIFNILCLIQALWMIEPVCFVYL